MSFWRTTCTASRLGEQLADAVGNFKLLCTRGKLSTGYRNVESRHCWGSLPTRKAKRPKSIAISSCAQEGSHPKQIGDGGMMTQKLEYMAHNNPVARGYMDDPDPLAVLQQLGPYQGLPGLIPVTTDWAANRRPAVEGTFPAEGEEGCGASEEPVSTTTR